jgi:hypothetical protein
MSDLATQPARAAGEFAVGGDLPVVRMGYGAMQIPGPGVWGEPGDHDAHCPGADASVARANDTRRMATTRNVFIVLLLIAFVYVWRRGALEWR